MEKIDTKDMSHSSHRTEVSENSPGTTKKGISVWKMVSRKRDDTEVTLTMSQQI